MEIPERFVDVRYNGAAHPRATVPRLRDGANCQRFVYELLRYFGYEIAPMRSSEMWGDRTFTLRAHAKRPLDILLFNRRNDPWGAHLALYLGGGRAIHLCKAVGRPAIWTISRFRSCDAYRVLVGIKRPIRLKSTPCRRDSA